MARRLLYAMGAAAAIGASAVGGMAIAASTNSPTPTRPAYSTPTGQNSSAWQSNEDPTHEKGESAAREADETAGRGDFGHPGGWNEDPAHEQSEGAAREAQEAAGGPGGQSSGSTTTAPSATSTSSY